MEQQFGNIKLKIKENKASDIQVYKCPFLSCTESYMNYQDLQSHKVLAHAQLPKFFKTDSLSGGFSKTKIRKLNMYSTKYVLNTYLTMLKLMLGSGDNIKPKKVKA